MAKQTFVWHPDLGANQSITPTVVPTRFGDGYEVRVPNGINYKPRSWSVVFTRGLKETQEILEFLENRGGKDAFLWTDPMNKTATYVCREWSSNQVYFGVYSVTATFEQVFEY